jgi:hypothetical protein
MRKINLELVEHGNLYAVSIESPLHETIAMAQLNDEEVRKIKQKLEEKDPKFDCFRRDDKGVVWFGQRLVIPQDRDLKKEILDEAHLSKFTIHPGSTKMYRDLRKNFWWSNMKGEIAEYVSGCDTCQRIKASHLKTVGQMQPLSITAWKWDDISMDFIIGLPLTRRKHDSMWVIVDRLTKTAHFIPVHTTYSAERYAEIYVDLIVRLHGVPKTICRCLNLSTSIGGTRSKVEGGDHHDPEPEGTREDTRHKIYTGSVARVATLRPVWSSISRPALGVVPGRILDVRLGTRPSFI